METSTKKEPPEGETKTESVKISKETGVAGEVDKDLTSLLKKMKDGKSEHSSTENVGRNFTDTFKTILSSVLKTDLGQVLKNRSDKNSVSKGNSTVQNPKSVKPMSQELATEESEKVSIPQSSVSSMNLQTSYNDTHTSSLNEDTNKLDSDSSVLQHLPLALNDVIDESENTGENDKSCLSKESIPIESLNIEGDATDTTCADSESSDRTVKTNKARKSVAKIVDDDKSDDSKSTNVSNVSEPSTSSSVTTPRNGQNRRCNYKRSPLPVSGRTGKKKIRQFKGGTYPLSIKPKRRRKKNDKAISKAKSDNGLLAKQMEMDEEPIPLGDSSVASEIGDETIEERSISVVENESWLDNVEEKEKPEVKDEQNNTDCKSETLSEDVHIVKNATTAENTLLSVTTNAEIQLKNDNIQDTMIAPSSYSSNQKNEVTTVSDVKSRKENNVADNNIEVKSEKPFSNARTLSPSNSENSEFHLEMSASSRTSMSMVGEDFEEVVLDVADEETELDITPDAQANTQLLENKNNEVEIPSGQTQMEPGNELESSKDEIVKGEIVEGISVLPFGDSIEKNEGGENKMETDVLISISTYETSDDKIHKPRLARLRDAKGKFSKGIAPLHSSEMSSELPHSSMMTVNPGSSPPRRTLSSAKPRRFTFYRNRRRFLFSGRNRKRGNKKKQQLPLPTEDNVPVVCLPEESIKLPPLPETKEYSSHTNDVSSEIIPSEGRMSVALSVKRRHGLKRRREEDDLDSYSSPWVDNLDLILPRRAKKVASIANSVGKASSFPTPQNEVPKPSIQLCTCQENCTSADTPILKETYCQAIDCIDDRLIGCCNLVTRPILHRPSRTIPFVVMCDVHRFRLRAHHCCPGCGFFCTQGLFVKCSNESSISWHLFHERCCLVYDGEALCPHCGCMSDWVHVRLRISGIRPAVFYPKQQHMNKQPSARMTITRGSDLPLALNGNDENPSKSYKIFHTGKEISTEGLPFGPDRSQLETLLVNLALEKPMNLRYIIKSMYNAAKSNDVEKILHMLAMGFDPNHKFEEHDNETAIHAACGNGHIVIVHVLHQAGGDLDVLDNKLRTPLMVAVENRQTAIIQYLIRSGTHLEARGEDGMTVLHLASKAGNLEACQMILETGKININIQDDGGWTPVVWAAEHRHKEIARFLLESGSDPNIRDNEHNIALHWAAFSGSLEICEMLLNRGCDLTNVNEHGDTPLHIAARQDNYDCVILFLARNADITIKNKENEIPLNCCPDENSQTWMALSMNSRLKRFAQSRKSRSEVLLHKDISKGNESSPIPCVNGFDDEPYPTDYLYIIENCETSPINVDRSITSLQSCQCEGDCSSINCTCSSLSLKCWYTREGGLIPEFNLLDPPMIFECNRACRCWKNCNNRVVQQGITSRLQLFRTNGKGWGVRTLRDIPRGTFICEYVGEVISDSEADHREDDSYLFDLDNRDGETYCIDARHYGNISRFINHLCEPNLVPVKVFIDHQDLRFPRIAFFSSRDIKAYEELGFDYGEKFWIIKYKTFTCMCDSEKCKYSADKIQEMLENYMRRQKEEVES